MNTLSQMRTLTDRIKTLIKQSIHFLYNRLIKPRSETDDSRRREFILNIILVGSLCLLIWSDIHILFTQYFDSSEVFDRSESIPFSIFTIIVAAFFSLYALSRSGYFVIASYLLIVLYMAGTSYGMYRWGFDLPAGLLSLGLIIVMSSILISSRFGFAIALLIMGTLVSLGWISNASRTISPWKAQIVTATDAIQYAIILLIIATISWISNREIEKSLIRAKRSEEELKEERDLLEIKIEERTKELKLAQLEKMSQLYRFAEFGRLSSGLFHDLLNPLTAVALNINKLEQSPHPEAPEIANYVRKAVKASKRMEHFIEAIRKQIRTEELSEIFSVNDEIEQAIELLSYKARLANVSIMFVADTPIKVYGNAIKFHQIISNLISNAIDAYIDVADKNTRCTVIVQVREENERVHVSVTDKGCGIATEILEKIFDPFFTTKLAYRGTGLGLSTTKGIIEKDFAGKITVKSTPSKGSTFSVIFPHKLHASNTNDTNTASSNTKEPGI